MRSYRPKKTANKNTILTIGALVVTLILIFKLFQLQVLAHNHYQEIATREQFGLVELPAQRGEILITDFHSSEEFLVATNTTLNLVYVDPVMVNDPTYVGEKIHPYLFDLEEAQIQDQSRIEEELKNAAADISEEDLNKIITPLTEDQLKQKHKEQLINKISETQRKQILLVKDLKQKLIEDINSIGITGIEIINNDLYAYPPQIQNTESVARTLAPLIQIPSTKLKTILKGQNRYVILKKRLPPDASEAIAEMIKNEPEQFTGVGMQEEYYRYYPEGSLAANVIGYSDNNNNGQYGIESSFDKFLKGKPGRFQTKKDSIGRQITVGESIIEPAKDGEDILLTIDRSVQLKVDQIIEDAVKRYRAHSGQAIVMNPKDGSIIALSHYPTFDPNSFGEVFKRTEINFTEEERQKLVESGQDGVYYFYINETTRERFTVFEETDKEGNSKFYRYDNYQGPEVYHNKAVAWPYEPGSTYKTIAMAIGIEDGTISPSTKYNDVEPIGVDWNPYTEDYDFYIKNSDGHKGLVDMTTVLGKSLNTGMTFIAQKIGPALFYDYMENFGLLDPTDIEFDDEQSGNVQYFEDWSESELATHSFGQGLTINMIQLANAYSVIANGGILMQPHIVKEVRHANNKVTTTEPKEIRRVISQKTSDKMTAMLVQSTEIGVADMAQIEGHYEAGKTGTSQTYRNGVAVQGVGTTIASFAGFGPVDDPKFVILVKLDKPKTNQWGSETAAPTFARIAEYLFEYYNIPPDKF